MEIRSILVHVDGSERSRDCIDLALLVARRHCAEVNALFAPVLIHAHDFDPAWPVMFDMRYGETAREEREARRVSLEHHFFAGLLHADLKGHWHTSLKHTQNELLFRSRFADLIVVSQSDPNDPDASLGNRLQAQVTLGCGRPVLWVPYAGTFSAIGDEMLVAWDAGQSSTRALYDAVPFMRMAKHVSLVTYNAEREGRVPGADIALVLARHEVNVEVSQLHTPPTVTVGEALLSRVNKTGCDLLVMGAYGHSRWRELMLGGVTQTVLGSMSVPVLMSH